MMHLAWDEWLYLAGGCLFIGATVGLAVEWYRLSRSMQEQDRQAGKPKVVR